MLRENLEKVFTEYGKAKTKGLSGHPLEHFLRLDFPRDLESLVGKPERYRFFGSAGKMENWATCPWVRGHLARPKGSLSYVAYLFRGDMSGVYLCLIQDVDEVKKELRARASDKSIERALTERSRSLRKQIGSVPARFAETTMNLKSTSSSRLPRCYEAANIFAVYYAAEKLPAEQELVEDFKEMLRLYDRLVSGK